MRIGLRQLGDEVVIEAFIHHSEVTEHWPGNSLHLAGRGSRFFARFAEVLPIHPAPVEMAVSIKALLGIAKFAPAGEYDIRAAQQLRLARFDLRRRKAEFGKLIHAVINSEDFS